MFINYKYIQKTFFILDIYVFKEICDSAIIKSEIIII